MMHLRAPQGSRTCVVIRASLLSQVVTRLAFSNLYKHAIRHNSFQGLSKIVDGLKNKHRRRKTCDVLLAFVLTKKVSVPAEPDREVGLNQSSIHDLRFTAFPKPG